MRSPAFSARGAGAVLAAALLLVRPAAAQTPGPTTADTRQHQDIRFGELPNHLVTDAPFTLAAKATSGLPVTFEVVDGPATLTDRTIKLSGSPGLVTIRATQAGNDLFAAATPRERVFAVNPKPVAPVVVSNPADVLVAVGEPVVLEVRVTGEPQPTLQWRRDGRPIAGAQSRSLTVPAATPADAGAYDVVATNVAGAARSSAGKVTVTKRQQTITFFPPPTAMAGQTVLLTASASSGLPVHLEMVSGSGNLAGTMLLPTSTMVTLTATQSGDATYEAAAPVTQTIQVQAALQGQH